MEILQKIQKDLQNKNIEPESFERRIVIKSMLNDIHWTKTGNSERCISNSEQIKIYGKRFPRRHWTFLGPGDGKKWYGSLSCTPEGKCVSTATQMVERLKDLGHPVFKSINVLRGMLKRKGGRERPHIHFNADSSNTELLIRTIHSANQLSINGAFSSWV